MKNWNEAYDGVEMVALMEANELLPKLTAPARKIFRSTHGCVRCWISTSA